MNKCGVCHNLNTSKYRNCLGCRVKARDSYHLKRKRLIVESRGSDWQCPDCIILFENVNWKCVHADTYPYKQYKSKKPR